MKYKEVYSLANDCTEIEYWKELRNISILTPSLIAKAYSIRGKRPTVPLSCIINNNKPLRKSITIKQKSKTRSISNCKGATI